MPLSKTELAQLEEFEHSLQSTTTAVWWSKLSVEQKFGIYQLQKFGYQLAFVRQDQAEGSLAVTTRGDQLATVNQLGSVNLTPQIRLRQGGARA